MAVTAEDIEAFFVEYGWTAQRRPDTPADWHTSFKGDSGVFTILLRLKGPWLFAGIIPLIEAGAGKLVKVEHGKLIGEQAGQRLARLYRRALELNQQLSLVKLTVAPNGTLCLMAEYPTASMQYSEFADILNALSHYGDMHYPELRELAG